MTPDEYIEILKDNGIYLLEYQKIFLNKIINDGPRSIYLIPSRHCGYSYSRILADIYLEVNNYEN